MDERTLTELRSVAVGARDAVAELRLGRVQEAEAAYVRLRQRAARLNAEFAWAPADEFSAMVPTIQARRQIDALDTEAGDGEREWTASLEEVLTGK